MIYEKGRVVMKLSGREAGKYCVIVEPIDDTFVMITGPKDVTRVRRRKCNIEHVEPTKHKLDIGSGSDEDVKKAWNDSGKINELGIVIPTFRKVEKK